jgi:imidazolonepropionase-like amidohydrolase
MKNVPRATFLSASLGSGAALLGVRAPVFAQAGGTAFTELRLIDGTGRPPIPDAVILVDASGRVTAAGPRGSVAIPAAANVVRLSGATIVPALLDAHAHVGLLNGNTVSTDNYSLETVHGHLARFAAYGVYAVQSLGTDGDLIYAIRRDQSAGGPVREARIVTAGHGFGAADGGWPPQNVGKLAYRPRSVDEARANVRELAAKQPDLVKLWVDDNFGRAPRMPLEVERAIVDEAHAHGLRVVAHLFYLADAKRLVAGGVDMIGHSVRDQAIDDELLAMMKRAGTIYVPTMTIDESHYIYADRPAWMRDAFFQRAMAPAVYEYLGSDAYRNKIEGDGDTPKWRAAAAMSKRNAAIAFRAGIPVALGTDAGAAVERIPGFDPHRELELLVGVGLSPLQAIRAGTAVSAAAMGPRGREMGTLEPGKLANFVVLEADPLADIRNTRTIREIWYHGQRAQFVSLDALHAREGPLLSVAELFDPANRHLRSICC